MFASRAVDIVDCKGYHACLKGSTYCGLQRLACLPQGQQILCSMLASRAVDIVQHACLKGSRYCVACLLQGQQILCSMLVSREVDIVQHACLKGSRYCVVCLPQGQYILCSMLASKAVAIVDCKGQHACLKGSRYCGFDPQWNPTKHYTIGICCFSLLNHTALRSKNTLCWLRVRIMCPSGVTWTVFHE